MKPRPKIDRRDIPLIIFIAWIVIGLVTSIVDVVVRARAVHAAEARLFRASGR